jgi:hypothetical protein
MLGVDYPIGPWRRRPLATKSTGVVEHGTSGRGRRAVWKFVAADVEDLDEIDWRIERFGLPISNVWVMPEGTSTAGLTAHTLQLADAALEVFRDLTVPTHRARAAGPPPPRRLGHLIPQESPPWRLASAAGRSAIRTRPLIWPAGPT